MKISINKVSPFFFLCIVLMMYTFKGEQQQEFKFLMLSQRTVYIKKVEMGKDRIDEAYILYNGASLYNVSDIVI